MAKSEYVNFEPTGRDEKVYESMSNRIYVAFDQKKCVVERKIAFLVGEAYEDFITYPFVTLNRTGYVQWIVASCHPLDIDNRLKRIETKNGPLPYRVTIINNSKAVFHWYLRMPIRLSLSGWRKAEVYYKSTYINFCKTFDLGMERFHTFAYNPLYIGYKTGLLVNADYSINDFSQCIKNQYDKNFYFDAKDYIFKLTSEYARKVYRDFRPKPEERGRFTRLILEYMEEIDVTDWPDSHIVAYDDLAEYIINYLFTRYDKVIEDFPTIQSKRGAQKGKVQRDMFLSRVLELRRRGYGYKRISHLTKVPTTTVERWVRKYGSFLDEHDDNFNRDLAR